MIITRPDNLGVKSGLYLIFKKGSCRLYKQPLSHLLVVPQPLYPCTTSYLPALSKATTGNSNLSLSFKLECTSYFLLHQTGFFEGISAI